MYLDASLISQFVKVTNDSKPTKSEQTVYGTVVIYDEKKYVKIDGSELLTPIAATTKVDNDERVMVLIKNHTATVTGNLTSPSARDVDVETIGTKITEFETVIADKVDTIQLNAVSGRIDDLQTDFVTVKDSLTAVNADIINLEADNVTIKESLTAVEADIEDLTAQNVTVTGKLEAAEANIGTLQADNVLIRGDLTAQNAYITNLEADYATFKEATVGKLEANEADIETLYADKLNANDADIKYATITNLEAANAKITNLESTFGDFEVLTTNKLFANEASIGELEAKYAEIESLDTKYANIDFANIGEAAIETLFSKSGLIEDIVVNNGTITGNLVGVTIKGDLIEGNTVVADKLVVKGKDGLYYKLNTDGVTIEAEQTDYNSLNGSIITAKSITATKIAVSDLVAFDATIGGFKITDDAIRSVVKTSVNNTTRGIYLDNTGQMAVGDATNYIKYYKDTDGKYKLSISADSLMFSSGANLNDLESLAEDIAEATSTANEAVTRVSSAETQIQQNKNQIALMATKSEVTESLSGYYTKTQTDAAITVSANSISSTVASTYATKTDLNSVETRVSSTETSITQNSNSIESLVTETTRLDNKFDDYSTTTEMNTLINQTSSNIRLEASQTYATQEDADEAKSTANTANTAAEEAKSTANTANTAAEEAKSTANTANTAAEEAKVSAGSAQATADNQKNLIDKALIEIDSLKNAISMLVTGRNGESLMVQTENGWQFNMTAVLDALDTNSSNIDALDSELSETNNQVDILDQAVVNLGEYTGYIRFALDNGSPCIILGETDSDFKVKITNTAIKLMEGTNSPAIITNNRIEIENAYIKGQLQQGGFAWAARSNGNYGLVWG